MQRMDMHHECLEKNPVHPARPAAVLLRLGLGPRPGRHARGTARHLAIRIRTMRRIGVRRERLRDPDRTHGHPRLRTSGEHQVRRENIGCSARMESAQDFRCGPRRGPGPIRDLRPQRRPDDHHRWRKRQDLHALQVEETDTVEMEES